MKATVKPVMGALLVMIYSPNGGFYIRYVENFNYYYERFVTQMKIKETTVLQ